jgi:hypothetical protein
VPIRVKPEPKANASCFLREIVPFRSRKQGTEAALDAAAAVRALNKAERDLLVRRPPGRALRHTCRVRVVVLRPPTPACRATPVRVRRKRAVSSDTTCRTRVALPSITGWRRYSGADQPECSWSGRLWSQVVAARLRVAANVVAVWSQSGRLTRVSAPAIGPLTSGSGGAPRGIRTPNRQIRSLVLYPLS